MPLRKLQVCNRRDATASTNGVQRHFAQQRQHFTAIRLVTHWDDWQDRTAEAMAIKKSELYSSLWASCDELRGGMDASQYKDYVLVLLFIKYVSDKYAGQPFAPITIPEGASFADMVALKGNPTSATRSTRRSSARWPKPTSWPTCRTSTTPTKLGTGKEMVDRLTNLIAIFETRRWTSPRTAPMATTFSAMPTNT
jgi:hypothetical protein